MSVLYSFHNYNNYGMRKTDFSATFSVKNQHKKAGI